MKFVAVAAFVASAAAVPQGWNSWNGGGGGGGGATGGPGGGGPGGGPGGGGPGGACPSTVVKSPSMMIIPP